MKNQARFTNNRNSWHSEKGSGILETLPVLMLMCMFLFGLAKTVTMALKEEQRHFQLQEQVLSSSELNSRVFDNQSLFSKKDRAHWLGSVKDNWIQTEAQNGFETEIAIEGESRNSDEGSFNWNRDCTHDLEGQECIGKNQKQEGQLGKAIRSRRRFSFLIQAAACELESCKNGGKVGCAAGAIDIIRSTVGPSESEPLLCSKTKSTVKMMYKVAKKSLDAIELYIKGRHNCNRLIFSKIDAGFQTCLPGQVSIIPPEMLEVVDRFKSM